MNFELKTKNLKLRAEIITAARSFFCSEKFLEVDTPLLVDAPIAEKFIDAIRCGNQYLVTSPEVYMKQLVSEGCPRIFQISKCFRAGETGRLHRQEFSMLEWYRTDADYFDLVKDVQGLLIYITEKLGREKTIVYNGAELDLNSINKISVDDAFLEFADKKLEAEPDDFEFDSLLVEKIEPKLGFGCPAVLYDYPSVFCPMTKPKKNNPERAERLEIYAAGIELANGCTEKTNYEEQVKSLKKERVLRGEMGKDSYPWPKKFLKNFKNMPECAGMALGIDRLVMLFANAEDIKDVTTF